MIELIMSDETVHCKQDIEGLVYKYQDKLYNSVYRLCGHHHVTEEICQEAFCRAIEKIEDFKGKSQFFTWLYRIALNLTISHLRRNKKVKFYPIEEWHDEIFWRLPETSVLAEEESLIISQALNELNPDYKIAIVLHDVEDMQYEQIASMLNVSLNTLKSRIFRGRKILKEYLTGYFRDGKDSRISRQLSVVV